MTFEHKNLKNFSIYKVAYFYNVNADSFLDRKPLFIQRTLNIPQR